MKLSSKIILLMTLISVLTGVIIGGVTIRSSNVIFEKYIQETHQIEISEWEDLYTSYYENNGGSWDNVENLLLNLRQVPSYYGATSEDSAYYKRQTVLIDTHRRILAHPQEKLVGQRVNKKLVDHGFPIYDSRSILIGYLLPLDYFDHQFWLLEESFNDNMQASIITGVSVTVLIAAIIGFLFARNMIKPLQRVIELVRRMGHATTNEKISDFNDDEIGELAMAFNQMSDELAKNNEMRVQLFADISHELRTPLTVIAGKLENKLMRNEICQPEEISSLYDEVLRLNGLVSELQNISRIDAGHMMISKTLIDFKNFFADFFLLVNADAEARDIALTVDIEKELPYCYADPERLKQIVLNLFSNALRYTKNGGAVLFHAWSEKDSFMFSVTDTGIGMTEEECAHVFDRFYRTDQSRARETGGTGLGMAITQGLVLAHGGRIEVKSKKNIGTTFTVALPLYKEV